MSWRSTSVAWGKVTRWLHWISAVVIIFGLTHGYWTANMLPRPQRLPHYWFHSLVCWSSCMCWLLSDTIS
jgi:cytochrome b561